MLNRKSLSPPEHIYPTDDWKLIERKFDPKFLAQNETIFSVGNGYLGLRGNHDEGSPVFQAGNFVNGFHETWPIVYGENAYGFATTGQTMVNLPSCKIIKLYVDDEPFYLPTANLLEYERILDMKSGTLDRTVLWEMASGKQISIQSRRIVSLQHRHLAAISYKVTVLNSEAPVVLSTGILSGINNNTDAEDDPRLAKELEQQILLQQENHTENHRIVLGYETKASRMTMACAADHIIETSCHHFTTIENSDNSDTVVFSFDAKPGVPIHITKYISYHTSRGAPVPELCSRARRTLDRAMADGFKNLLESQGRFLNDFWRKSDIQIETAHPRAQQCIRFNLFHILQASARAEGTSVCAKGLTGQAYEGHYFWDTEIYLLPFLIYTAPRIARNILKFRYSMLDKARQRARAVNQRGALFPWRTINGEEASAYYAAGTAQYHINADIMYALKKYVDVTGDEAFLYKFGTEMLVETARLWCDLGFFTDGPNPKFQIHSVTGPDEYTAIVNNNTYTNLMARHNLQFAVTSVEALQQKDPAQFAALVHDTGLELSEVAEWKRAAENMFIPYNDELGINPQDDSFLEKKRWDLKNTPADKFPLLLYYHPLVIYRHQVIKQADVVLAMLLFEEEFSQEQKKRNFDYYDPLTTGDSSLSVCIQSILSSELGYMEKALDYFRYAVLMDLSNIGGNVKDGVHIASMGGTWMGLVYGFAGMRDNDGCISFSPRLPSTTKKLQFSLQIRGSVLELNITQESATYLLKEGPELTIRHYDKEINLTEGVIKSCRTQKPKAL
ncbi:MAG: glycoside hydrolase family 65 protein [Deltaproteobacteria bacterium]|nr:glycoside hydrolase family 65 protein [Deltaproteobacteria bacterium]